MKKSILTSISMALLAVGAVRAQDNTLTTAEKNEGYKLVFDGTIDSWKASWVDYVQNDSTNTTLDGGWKINPTEPGVLQLPSGSVRDIRSRKKYKNFELRWKYKIDGNQGVFYRALLTHTNAWYTGVEYAINNVTNLGKDNPSAAYDLYAPPNPVPYNNSSTNLWNEGRIVAIGDSIEHYANGQKVVAYRVHSTAFWAVYNAPGCKWPTTGNKSLTNLVPGTQEVGKGYIETGYLGIQGDHGGKWKIKDMKVTETPCFGVIKPDGSVCPISALADPSERKVAFSSRREGNRLLVEFADEGMKSADIVGIDGKVIGSAKLSFAGRKAAFANAPKSGLYFLKLVTDNGILTRKLNLL